MFDIPSEASNLNYRDVINCVVLGPSSHFSQPYEFEKGKEYDGNVGPYVDEWYKDMSNVDEHNDLLSPKILFLRSHLESIRLK